MVAGELADRSEVRHPKGRRKRESDPLPSDTVNIPAETSASRDSSRAEASARKCCVQARAGRTARGAAGAYRLGMPDPDFAPFDFATYQRDDAVTGLVVVMDHPIVYPTLGLVNEAGEVAGKVKKIFRDHSGVVTQADRDALTLELGDVLWYLSELCSQLEIRLEDVAARNIEKVRGRMERGTLTGSGDTR